MNVFNLNLGLAAPLAFILTLVFAYLLIPLAKRIGLVDKPGGRKLHGLPTPVIGGVAMYLAFGISLLALDVSLQPYRFLLAGSCLLVFTGVLDDFHELTPRFRLFVQIVTGILMVVWGKVTLLDFGNLIPLHDIQVNYTIGFIVTVCAVIGVINAVNMLDGVDGLVGTIALVQLTLLAYLASQANLWIDVVLLATLIAVVLGYLYFNFPFPWRKHAVVFMGDAGSMFLGFLMVWFMIYLSQPPHRAASPSVFLWIMAIPLFDIGALLIRRPLNKRSPLRAGRDHIHHLLQAFGLGKFGVVATLCIASLTFGLIGIFASHYQISSRWLFIAFVLSFIFYVILAEILWRRVNRR